MRTLRRRSRANALGNTNATNIETAKTTIKDEGRPTNNDAATEPKHPPNRFPVPIQSHPTAVLLWNTTLNQHRRTFQVLIIWITYKVLGGEAHTCTFRKQELGPSHTLTFREKLAPSPRARPRPRPRADLGAPPRHLSLVRGAMRETAAGSTLAPPLRGRSENAASSAASWRTAINKTQTAAYCCIPGVALLRARTKKLREHHIVSRHKRRWIYDGAENRSQSSVAFHSVSAKLVDRMGAKGKQGRAGLLLPMTWGHSRCGRHREKRVCQGKKA